MQKINPFHKPNLSIQQILGSHELNGHVHFLPYPPKNYWNNFAMWICTSMQNISSFHLFILETRSISESHEQTNHARFWPCPTKKFWSTFNLCKLLSTCKKIRLFHWFVLEIRLTKSCNLISWEHFGPYTKNNNFSKYKICAWIQQTT